VLTRLAYLQYSYNITRSTRYRGTRQGVCNERAVCSERGQVEAPGTEGQGRVYVMRELYTVREDRDLYYDTVYVVEWWWSCLVCHFPFSIYAQYLAYHLCHPYLMSSMPLMPSILYPHPECRTLRDLFLHLPSTLRMKTLPNSIIAYHQYPWVMPFHSVKPSTELLKWCPSIAVNITATWFHDILVKVFILQRTFFVF